MLSHAKNLWVTCPRPRPLASIRLFCFPYAGGGASIYRAWGDAFPSPVEVRPLQLPGHENRLSEAPVKNIRVLIETLAIQITSFLDRPFAFFGHSMGALLCFELTHYLYQQWGLLPQFLFVSAYRAPHLEDRHPPTYQMPDQLFLEHIAQFNGTPTQVLENAELMQFFLPTLRADFALCETYQYPSHTSLPCPLAAFGGLKDENVLAEDLRAWEIHTQSTFGLHLFPGNHFFIHTDTSHLIEAIVQHLRPFHPAL